MEKNQTQTKTALVLMNLGSPNSTRVKDVKKYLSEFLMDEYVIDYPYLFRYMLVNGVICNFRAPKSALAYQKIWSPEGSPLIVKTRELAAAIRQKVEIPVLEMMRYGDPSPQAVFQTIKTKYPDIKKAHIIPLYPHWTMSSYETAVAYSKKIHEEYDYKFNISFQDPFYDQKEYIQALANSIQPYLQEPFDQLLFSYHGIPTRHIRKDIARRDGANRLVDFNYPDLNYQEQCLKTSQLVADALGLSPDRYQTSFQSRLRAAGNKWLQPATATIVQNLAQKGKQRIVVVCPAFINDCLETLEEIDMEVREIFMEQGGKSFVYVPCLNSHPDLVDAMIQWSNLK